MHLSGYSTQVTLMLPVHSSQIDIVVLGNGSLFDEGVGSLLIGNSQLNISRILYTNDKALVQRVKADRPQAVFLNEFDPLETDHLIGLIFSIPNVAIKWIVVTHLENNVIDIHNKPAEKVLSGRWQTHSVTVRSKEELIVLARSLSV